MDMISELSAMATRIIRENLSSWSPDPLYPRDAPWPQDFRRQFHEFAEQISRSLCDDDVQRYGCYVQVVAPQFGTNRSVDDLAITKAGMLLYYATLRVGAEKLISGAFEDSALASRAPDCSKGPTSMDSFPRRCCSLYTTPLDIATWPST